MSSSLASKIKMAAIFLFSGFWTQFFAIKPPMYVSFRGNYQYRPNMVLSMIYIKLLKNQLSILSPLRVKCMIDASTGGKNIFLSGNTIWSLKTFWLIRLHN